MATTKTIQNFVAIIAPVLSANIGKQKTFPIEVTFLHVLERVRLSLQSLYVLVKDDLLKNDHGIGLISRNLLSDFIITGHIIHTSSTEEEMTEKLYSMYNSDLKKQDAFIRMFKDSGMMSDDEFNNYFLRYDDDSDMHKIIRDNYNLGNQNFFPTTKNIIEEFLKTEIDDKWVHEIKNGYDIWVFFSKYEHLGWGSYSYTRNTELLKAEQRLKSVIFKTIILAASCCEILEENDALEQLIDLMNSEK